MVCVTLQMLTDASIERGSVSDGSRRCSTISIDTNKGGLRRKKEKVELANLLTGALL